RPVYRVDGDARSRSRPFLASVCAARRSTPATVPSARASISMRPRPLIVYPPPPTMYVAVTSRTPTPHEVASHLGYPPLDEVRPEVMHVPASGHIDPIAGTDRPA